MGKEGQVCCAQLADDDGRREPTMGKTRGLGAGRKLRLHRKSQLWADKDYKKANIGSEWKKPFAGCSHSKGSSSRRSESRPSSPTPLFVSAPECSSSRTERRSPPSPSWLSSRRKRRSQGPKTFACARLEPAA